VASSPGRQVVFSGIQPTGVPHIGNYIGALQTWLRLQETKKEGGPETKMELYFSIVGLHAITLPRDPLQLRKDRFEMMCVLLAIGLDPDLCCLFNQDQVPAHSEMAWILNCIAPVGRLSRMTTWKAQLATSKNSNSIAEVDESMLHLGLLAYPVLQSADILLYKATQVPIGDDQTQHLELTKALAKSLNNLTHNHLLFPLPQGIYSRHSKIQNLRDPGQKMSKSHVSEMSKILITDTAETMARKIKSAVTDSQRGITFDVAGRPGVSNLLAMYAGISGWEMGRVEARFGGKTVLDLKNELAELLVEHFRPFQSRFHHLQNNPNHVQHVFRNGALAAARVANRSLNQVKQLLGLD